jgi:hypothetical protein
VRFAAGVEPVAVKLRAVNASILLRNILYIFLRLLFKDALSIETKQRRVIRVVNSYVAVAGM